MKKLFKKPSFIIFLVIVVIAVIGGYKYLTRTKEPSYDFIIAERGDLIQEVSVTGKVEPAQEVDLAFEQGGKISQANIKVGDKVVMGQTLLSLNNADLIAQLNKAQAEVESAKAQEDQAQASVEAEQSKLEEYQAGVRTEEIQIAETTVTNAEQALEDAEINLINVENKTEASLNDLYDEVDDILNNVYIDAVDAVNTQTDEMFDNDNMDNPQLTFQTSVFQYEIDSEAQRVLARDALNQIETLVENLPFDQTVLDETMESVYDELIVIRDFLTKLYSTVNTAIGLSQTTINNYKSYINTARTAINTAISNINDQQQDILVQKTTNDYNISVAQASVNDAQSALLSAQNNLTLKQAGYTPKQIAAQEAVVRQAQANLAAKQASVRQTLANVQNIQANLEKTILRAPITGIITKQEATVGEIVAVNTTLVSIISESQFEIKANIPEVDIAKVKINDLAKVTLDAYGSDIIFQAKVIKISPAETIIEGVSVYKTTFQLTEEDGRIKSGMTANLDIATASKENVITVPQRAIITKNGDKSVRILVGEEIQEVSITTGLRGSTGNVEVVEGVREGDRVITFMEE